SQKIVELAEIEAPRQRFEPDRGHAMTLQLLFNDLAPLRNRRLMILAAKPLPDFRPRASAAHESERGIKPVTARPTSLGSKDFHLLSVFKRCVKRYHRAVYLGAAAAMAKVA